jgi:predicted lipoprotein with Yx(FWY)xxD motif
MTRTQLAAVAALGSLTLAAAVQAAAPAVPYATPAGITIVDVDKVLTSSSAQFIWRRLGDANGKALYTYDKDPDGKATCTAECAQEFTPFLADRAARPSGDWTLITRSDHARQWAYQGKALYRYNGEDPPGEPFGGDTATQAAENPQWYDPGSKFYSPKPGLFHRAAYSPEKSFKVPAGIALQSLAVANGFGLVDSASGMTLYAIPKDKDKGLSREWKPEYASALALPVADFNIITRPDGTHQWTYQGRPLYRYEGDYAPGEVNGIFEDKAVTAALVYRNYLPAEFAIGHYTGRGPLLTTRDGLSVYTQARYNLQYGGRETRTGYVIPYNIAKDVGTQGCVGSCNDTWKPVKAPANALSWGFWEVVTRPDGSKQWAYKGSALYTYVGDHKGGDIEGNNRHVIVYGDPEGKTDLSVVVGQRSPGGGPSMESGAGYYWHIAGLFF